MHDPIVWHMPPYLGNHTLNSNVLIEIGAAFVLYDRRVVLVRDRRQPVPSNLQGLYRCEYEGSELSWAAGMKLMKAIQGSRAKASRADQASRAAHWSLRRTLVRGGPSFP